MQTGSKYEETRDLTTGEIAALVRKEIRAAQKTRGFKAKVTSGYFSMGSAIRVRLDFPDDADRIAAATVVQWAKTVLDQYNRQDVDSQIDHFNVRFYGTVTCNLHPMPLVTEGVDD